MYPEDRVLIGVMPDPRDFQIAADHHWYRIPIKHGPKGIHAEYVAFYFTGQFPPDLRWGIHFFARRTGHELVRRIDLFPQEEGHPRAGDIYFKIQLGELRERLPPIASPNFRRVSFIETTWDRFVAAATLHDLVSTDPRFVERLTDGDLRKESEG